MTEVIVDTVELAVTNAATTISVETNQGPAGPRGNYTFVNTGTPASQTSYTNGNYYLYGNLLQAGDVYIQQDGLLAYQFKVQPGGMAWVRIGETLDQWELADSVAAAAASASAAAASAASAAASLGVVNIYAASWYA